MTGWDQPRLPFTGTYPYAGTSGYAAGSPTSEARTRDEDARGVTGRRQGAVLRALQAAGPDGMTVREVRALLELHHGEASGALSNLHLAGAIARLADVQRFRCSVYVAPEHVAGRPTEPHGSNLHAPARMVLTRKALDGALKARGVPLDRTGARVRKALRDLGMEIHE